MTAFNTNPGSGGPSFEADTEGAANWVVNKMGWGAAGSGQRTTLLQPFPVQSAATNFIFSASGQNTTTTQLAAAATFTGTIESTQNQPGVSVLLTTDQPGTFVLKQSIDSSGTFNTSTYTRYLLAGSTLSEYFPANGNFAQTFFTNTGAATTTTLNLNTAYGDLAAVDSTGRLPVSSPMDTRVYSVAGVIAINTILLTVDCINSRGVSIQCTSMGTTGVVTPQWSNDGVTYIAQSVMTTAGVAAATITAAGMWTSPVYGRYLQLKLTTATTAGTTTFVTQAMAQFIGAVQSQPVVAAAGTGLTASAAMADAFANPTLGKQAVVNMVYNGTTWDLQRGMSGNLTTGDTGAKTATGNGATVANVGNKGVSIVVNMGAVTGTTPTCVIKVQSSVDGGTNWVDVPGATTASLTATGLYGIDVYPGATVTAGVATTGTKAVTSQVISRAWRIVWTIGGTTPSFTITSVSYNYLPN